MPTPPGPMRHSSRQSSCASSVGDPAQFDRAPDEAIVGRRGEPSAPAAASGRPPCRANRAAPSVRRPGASPRSSREPFDEVAVRLARARRLARRARAMSCARAARLRRAGRRRAAAPRGRCPRRRRCRRPGVRATASRQATRRRSRSKPSQLDHASLRSSSNPASSSPRRKAQGIGDAVLAQRRLERGHVGLGFEAKRAALRLDPRGPRHATAGETTSCAGSCRRACSPAPARASPPVPRVRPRSRLSARNASSCARRSKGRAKDSPPSTDRRRAEQEQTNRHVRAIRSRLCRSRPVDAGPRHASAVGDKRRLFI